MPHPPNLLIINATTSPLFRTPPGTRFAVRCAGGRVRQIAPTLTATASDRVIDARGGTLLPGLHDHHIHLFATAAARRSIDCSELSAKELEARIAQRAASLERNAPQEVRVVNYHEGIAGDLERGLLDRWLSDLPLRIQHSTGQMWFLNSAALKQLRIAEQDSPGIERTATGEPTGRLFRCDELLRVPPKRTNTPNAANTVAIAPSLSELSRELASYGVTGVTDTSPANSTAEWQLIQQRQHSGELLQRVRLMGHESLVANQTNESTDSMAPLHPMLTTGELKILLDEAALPDIDELAVRVANAHAVGRGVAFHCVTRIELALIISVLEHTGSYHDRIEHASMLPLNTLDQLHALGVRVVTQPGLIRTRGDRYQQTLDAADIQDLYRLNSVIKRGIPLAGSSDAPYGPLNPWLTLQCATDRTTRNNALVQPAEALSPEQALALYCSAADAPGQASSITEGVSADLCVLSADWASSRAQLAQVTVAHTIRGGELIYGG